MKKALFLIILIISTLSLCGCYDAQEIDKSAYVIALGIDHGNNNYNYTFQISSPLAMGGGGEVTSMGDSEKNTRVENIVIGAKSLSDARTYLNNFLSKKINLSHLKIIIFSEDIARTGLKPHLPFLLREREIRPNTRLAISASTAENFIKGINPALEANTAEYYDLVFENGGAFAPPKTLWEFVNEQETFSSALPKGVISSISESVEFSENNSPQRLSTSKSEFSGLYLLKDYRLEGVLTNEQSKFFGIISGAINETEFSIFDGEEPHSIKIFSNGKGKFRIRNSDASTTVSCILKTDVELNSSSPTITPDIIKNHIETETLSLFNQLKKSNCDILFIGNNIKRKCKTIPEWEKLNWNEKFSSIYFLPEITVTLTKTDSGPI